MSFAGTLGRANKFFKRYALTQSDDLDREAFLQLSMACGNMARVLDEEDKAAGPRAHRRAYESSDDSEDSDSTMSETSSSSDSDGDSEGVQSPKDDDDDSHASAEDTSSSSDSEESGEENAGSVSSRHTRKRQRSPEQDDEESERDHKLIKNGRQDKDLEKLQHSPARTGVKSADSLATAYEQQANRELALKAADVVLNLPMDSVTNEMRERAKQVLSNALRLAES